MMQTLGHIALVVRDYDEALAFFTRTLNFRVIEDTRLSDDKRWVLIAPPAPRVRACFWPGQQRPSRRVVSATRPADESSFFCTPTISGATTMKLPNAK